MTFSSAVMEPKISRFWKVRAARAAATWPALAWITPEITPNRVDLPAPLGPISATTSPVATTRSTPSTARTPPNRRLTPVTRSTAVPGAGRPSRASSGPPAVAAPSTRDRGAGAVVAAAGRPAGEPADHRDQPARQQHHHRGQHHAEADQLVLARGAGDQPRHPDGEQLAEGLDEDGTEDRPPDAREAADHRHQQQLDREQERGRRGVHHRDPVGVHAAGDRRQ